MDHKFIYKKYLYNLKDYHDECFDDILLGIWNNINSFDESKNSFENWIAAISKYKAIDYKRKYNKHLEEENIEELNIPSKENTFETITKNELDKEVEQILDHLSTEDKNIFIKLFVEGKEVEYVSQEMNIHKNNIYNRVSKGKAKLRKLFQR
ncbi:MAG: sigma-70 family RNA polymerase sigma factor [Peptostreptococcaceae bacterium]